jgi:hypothetical protein
MRILLILSLLSLGYTPKSEPQQYVSQDGRSIAFNINLNRKMTISVYQMDKSIVRISCGRIVDSGEGTISAITADEKVVQSFILPASSGGWVCRADAYMRERQNFIVWVDE